MLSSESYGWDSISVVTTFVFFSQSLGSKSRITWLNVALSLLEFGEGEEDRAFGAKYYLLLCLVPGSVSSLNLQGSLLFTGHKSYFIICFWFISVLFQILTRNSLSFVLLKVLGLLALKIERSSLVPTVALCHQYLCGLSFFTLFPV